jgi:archaellum component FlaC
MDEIVDDLIACHDAVNCIDEQMQLLDMALEQLDRPITPQIKKRVELLVNHFQVFVESQLDQLKVSTKKIVDQLVTFEGDSEP